MVAVAVGKLVVFKIYLDFVCSDTISLCPSIIGSNMGLTVHLRADILEEEASNDGHTAESD